MTGHLSVRLLGALDTMDASIADHVISEWTTRVLTDLSIPCLNWLATNFSSRLTEQHRQQVCKSFDTILDRDEVTEDAAERHQKFFSELSQKELPEPAMQVYLDKLLPYIAGQYANTNGYLDLIFPVLPPLLSQARPAVVVEFLDMLFTRVQSSNPSLLGWLHGRMVGHWPVPSPDLAYESDRLFSGAIEVARQHANNEFAVDLLRSMEDMLGREIVGSNRASEVLDIAVAAWPHFPEQVVHTLRVLSVAPSPSQTAELVDGIDLGVPERSKLLHEAWTHVAHKMTLEQRTTVATSLLSEPPKGPPDEPDRALRLWIDVQVADTQEVLHSLLIEADLNDEQIKRVWLQTVHRADSLGSPFFIDVVPPLIKWADGTQTSRAIFDDRAMITGMFKSEDDRFEFGSILLKTLPDAPTVEAKNQLAHWIHEIGSRGVLSQLDSMTRLSGTELDALEQYFGKIPEIRKWRNRRDSE